MFFFFFFPTWLNNLLLITAFKILCVYFYLTRNKGAFSLLIMWTHVFILCASHWSETVRGLVSWWRQLKKNYKGKQILRYSSSAFSHTGFICFQRHTSLLCRHPVLHNRWASGWLEWCLSLITIDPNFLFVSLSGATK